jgi:hypothetical protein
MTTKQILDHATAQADPARAERMHEAFSTASRREWMFLGRSVAPGDLARLSGPEHQRDDGRHSESLVATPARSRELLVLLVARHRPTLRFKKTR